MANEEYERLEALSDSVAPIDEAELTRSLREINKGLRLIAEELHKMNKARR